MANKEYNGQGDLDDLNLDYIKECDKISLFNLTDEGEENLKKLVNFLHVQNV